MPSARAKYICEPQINIELSVWERITGNSTITYYGQGKPPFFRTCVKDPDENKTVRLSDLDKDMGKDKVVGVGPHGLSVAHPTTKETTPWGVVIPP